MLTPELIEHLNGPNSMSIGTSDLNMNPHFARIWGTHVGDSDDEIKLILPKVVAEQILSDTSVNKNISLNVASLVTLVTKQFKGIVIKIAPSTEREIGIADQSKARSGDILGQFFGEEARTNWMKYKTSPSYTIIFKVQEIFEQTPGKNAGMKLI